MKSLAVNLEMYLSMSKPPVKVTVRVSRTTARDNDKMVITVLLRLRPRLAQAMDSKETPLMLRFAFLLDTFPSV